MTALARPLRVRAQPWLERSGRLSILKLVVFVLLFVPGLGIALGFSQGWLGPKPLTEAIHGMGEWAIRFLLLSLAVTPLRRLTQWNKLLLVRRMLGLAALTYILVHFVLYVVSQRFDLLHVASEIVLRVYLTVGFIAMAIFVLLGSTSTDAVIRRLGPERWNRLHWLVYPATALGLWHFFMQAKVDVTEPTLMAGLFLILLGHRLLVRLGLADNIVALAGLSVVVGVLTALMEAGWYKAASGVPPLRVLEANLDFDTSIRPAWWVFVAGLLLLAIRLARPLWSRKPPQMRARAAA